MRSAVSAFKKVGRTDLAGKRITELEDELAELNKYFAASDKDAREKAVDQTLSKLIEHYADEFKLEKRGAVQLDKNELTLRFSRDGDKPEYLWEVGSGANWMGYHLSTLLAIHEFLSKHPELLVFGFLIIDQPSQVYFPSAASGANELDGKADALQRLFLDRGSDVRDTKRIFATIQHALQRAGFKFQVIVLEHADQDIWGTYLTKEVANWKAEKTGLIPQVWLQKL